jgi:hypothetical protein
MVEIQGAAPVQFAIRLRVLRRPPSAPVTAGRLHYRVQGAGLDPNGMAARTTSFGHPPRDR